MEVSFQRSAQNVRESIGSHPVQLKSKGIYSSPFQVSFTCMEIAPVEAEGWQLLVKSCKKLLASIYR